jgi:hypothetical protein
MKYLLSLHVTLIRRGQRFLYETQRHILWPTQDTHQVLLDIQPSQQGLVVPFLHGTLALCDLLILQAQPLTVGCASVSWDLSGVLFGAPHKLLTPALRDELLWQLARVPVSHEEPSPEPSTIHLLGLWETTVSHPWQDLNFEGWVALEPTLHLIEPHKPNI